MQSYQNVPEIFKNFSQKCRKRFDVKTHEQALSIWGTNFDTLKFLECSLMLHKLCMKSVFDPLSREASLRLRL